MDFAIEATRLRKVYRVYTSPWQRLRSLVTGQGRAREFVALDDVTLRVARGTAIGVLGPNGAGKSTLLKILAGVIQPSEGTISVRGRIGAILELGAGYHPEFTGRENLLLNAALLGFGPARTRELIEQVEAFCELGTYLDLPVKTYSSGMFVRLAFSAAIAVEPEILLVDEALAVGDAAFAHRCLARVREMRERGCTIVFVTHDTSTLTQVCDRAVLLAQGRLVADGPAREIVDLYLMRVAEQLAARSPTGHTAGIRSIGAREATDVGEKRFGSGEAEIVDCGLEGVDGRPLERVSSGAPVRFRALVRFHRRVEQPVFGVMIKNRHGIEIFGTNTHLRGIPTGPVDAGELRHVCFDMPLWLGAGSYTASFAVHTVDGHFFDYRIDARLFEVLPVGEAGGLVNLPVVVTVTPADTAEEPRVADLATHLYPDAPSAVNMSESAGRFLAGEWHAPQSDDAGDYRWLGREGVVFLARGQGNVLEMSLQSLAPDGDERPIALQVLLNGCECGRVVVPVGGPQLLRISLPAELLRPVNTITLVASRTWSPRQFVPEADDARQLSVLVRRIALP